MELVLSRFLKTSENFSLNVVYWFRPKITPKKTLQLNVVGISSKGLVFYYITIRSKS